MSYNHKRHQKRGTCFYEFHLRYGSGVDKIPSSLNRQARDEIFYDYSQRYHNEFSEHGLSNLKVIYDVNKE